MTALPDVEKLCMNCMNIKPNAASACPHCGRPAVVHAVSTDELPPRTILFGRYLLGGVTARGNMGILYAAYDLKRCRRVTIREYFPQMHVKRELVRPGVSRVVPISEELAASFQSGLEQCALKARQLIRLGLLSGMFVPQKHFSENGTAYTVLDFVQGVTLRRYVENTGGSRADALELLRPLAASLALMHGAGVAHGELTFVQIIVTPEGVLKVLPPWGAAPFESDVSAHLGKPSGKNARFTHQAAASDARALCAVLYTLLTGKDPVPLSSCEKPRDIPALSGRGVSLSGQKKRALKKCLCGGYKNMRELYWTLYGTAPAEAGLVRGQDNNATASLEKAVKTISGASAGKRPALKKRPGFAFLAGYAVFCLLLLGGAAFFMAQGGGPIVYALLAVAAMDGLSLWKTFRSSRIGRALHLALAAGAAALAGYIAFAHGSPVEGDMLASFALLLLNVAFVLVEAVYGEGALKRMPH